MEPTHFYLIVLPLAVLIVILVSMTLYFARKAESMYDTEVKKLRAMLQSGTIDKKTFERMRNRIKEEIIFAKELERLYALLQDKKINQDSYMQLKEQLEKTFRQRVKSLFVST